MQGVSMKPSFFLVTAIALSYASLPVLAVEDILVTGSRTSNTYYTYSTDDWYQNSMLTSDPLLDAAIAAGRSTYEAIQRQQKACATARAKIQKEYSECKDIVSQWNVDAVRSCGDLRNSSWTFGAGVDVRFLIFDISYTVNNPTYDQCINLAGAVDERAVRHCDALRDNALESITKIPVCS